MALPAGRKGVLPSELTPEGKIKNSGSSYVLPTASAETLGGVKVGSGLSIADGVLSASQYSLPTASAETLGGVKVGSGLSIADGVLSASQYSLPTASAETLGGVKVGSGLSIADGVLSASGGAGFGTLVPEGFDSSNIIERTYTKDGFILLSSNTSNSNIWSVTYDSRDMMYGANNSFAVDFEEVPNTGSRRNVIMLPVFAGIKVSFYRYTSAGVLLCTYIPLG